MPNSIARERELEPAPLQLAEVRWVRPSSEPDTSEIDAAWQEPRAPRNSYIALKALRSVVPTPGVAEPAAASSGLSYDVWDSPRATVVLVDLPGVDADQVALSLGSHALHLDVSVPSALECGALPSGSHAISVPVPDGIDPDSIDASLSQGLLRVHISKQHAGARHVAIQSKEG